MSATVLSEQMILSKTKVASLRDVQHLNLWGVGLSDVSIVTKLESAQVLALAANNISSLKPFASCPMLTELYLRKNNVAQLKEVAALKTLKKLHTLWLIDNPCAKHPLYREFVLHCCANLKQLDSVEVTAEERAAAAKKLTPKAMDEILGRSSSSSSTSGPTKAATSPLPAAKEALSPPSSDGSPRTNRSGVPSGQASIIEERSSSGKTVLYTTVQAQRAMLTAIVSLLPELSVESLELLEREVHSRIERQKQQCVRPSQGSESGGK